MWFGTEARRYELVIQHGGAVREIVGETKPVVLEGDDWAELQLVRDGEVPLLETITSASATMSLDSSYGLDKDPDLDDEVVGPGTLRARVEPGEKREFDDACGAICEGVLDVTLVTIPEHTCDGFARCEVTMETEDKVGADWLLP